MNKEKYISNTRFDAANLFNKTKKFLVEIPERVFILIENHRNSTRLKLSFNPVNMATFLSFFPFILGFYEFLNQKYPAQRKYLFFEKNLPSLSIPTEKIHWETFQYILKDQNEFPIVVNDISWSDKDFILQIPVTNSFITTEQKNLITYFHPLKKQTTISKTYKLSLNSNSHLESSIYYNLDEIPRKLQALHIHFPQKNSIDLYETKAILKGKTTRVNRRFLLQEYNPKTTFLLGVNSKENLLKKQFHVPEVPKLFNRFYQKEQTFNNEIRKLFIHTSLIPSFEVFNQGKIKTIFQFDFFKNQDFKSLQDVIREIDALSLPKSISLNRLMSGYRYPDMKLKQVIGLFFQGQDSQNRNIQILLPSSFLVPGSIETPHGQVPNFLIKSKKLVLKDQADHITNLYDGPAILLRNKTGFDWEIILDNSTNNNNTKYFRDWVDNYLNSTNPLSDSFKNFFGVFESPENSLNSSPAKVIKTNDTNYWFKNLPIFRTGILTNTTSSYFEFDRSFQIPVIDNKDWNLILGSQSDSNSLTLNTISLPIVETRIPKGTKPEFGYKPFVDFDFNTPLDFLKGSTKKHLQVTFSPSSSSYLNQETLETSLSSGIYQKIPSVLTSSSFPIFYDLWEPLTFKSWLVTSQIGFAFLVFTILKALADNYGRELLVYLLDLVALLGFLDDDLKQEIEILMGQREKGFRIISKTTKNFSNVGGIESLLPEIIEIVWFLRNSGREFSISKTLPRGVLLSGPPGTGKTLLVQAIAGEAEVPVLALSGSSLVEPGESGALKLEILFQEARRLAPCIVFIDEMDTLAEKREQVLQNPMGADEVLESLSTTSAPQLTKNSLSSETSDEIPDRLSSQQDMQKEKLRILMQFLVELDGIQGRDGVVVIGATNRPEMLDPAILRPGRFDRVLELGLPGPEKRKEILKLYSNNLGIDDSFSWAYLIHRTAGYSAADLASIMNQSTLNAIVQETTHTIETIEYGIDRITTIGVEKPFQAKNSRLATIQLAYYQAGKILLSALLEHHPPTLVTHLWPRRTNIRALQISQNLQKYFFRFARRIELEHRVIGCYAGKAAEILFLQNSSLITNTSDLGTEDIQFAQNLIKSMIDYWYFYGKTISIEKNLNILENYNIKEYRDVPEKVSFFNSFLENLESPIQEQSHGEYSDSQKKIENSIEQQAQKYFSTANWQYQISDEFEMATRAFSDWYRLYLPDPQQTERNLEWTPPDEFYQGNPLLEELTQSVNWNTVAGIHIDYQIHSLILQSFNKALVLLDQHREVLDKLAYELINREILREPEIEAILKQFKIELKNTITDPEISKEATDQIISQSWGTNSRRAKERSINIQLIQKNI